VNQYAKEYQFENGYGASVISHLGSYGGDKGLFEVAVLDNNGNITYDTPVTPDVVGFLDFAGVAEVLEQIKNLPPLPGRDSPLVTAEWLIAQGCKTGQMRQNEKVHNGGWYNATGEKIGWGDLNQDDIDRIAHRLPKDGVLFILGEQDSFWKFVTHNPGPIGDCCVTNAQEKNPGIEYVLERAFLVFVRNTAYWSDRYGYSSPNSSRTYLTTEQMRKLVQPYLICQSETA
jgi:hypothetical protein